MAKIVIDGNQLTIELTAWEKTKAVHGDVTVPLNAVTDVSVVDNPLDVPKGLRAPGTNIPGVTKAGSWRSSSAGRQFVLASHGERAVRIDLTHGRNDFDMLLVAAEDPEAQAAAIRTAAGL